MKVLHTMTKETLYLECKYGTTCGTWSTCYTILTKQNEKPMIISTDAENTFDKIQHLFIKKKNTQQTKYS
jgi:hypothetical protein